MCQMSACFFSPLLSPRLLSTLKPSKEFESHPPSPPLALASTPAMAISEDTPNSPFPGFLSSASCAKSVAAERLIRWSHPSSKAQAEMASGPQSSEIDVNVSRKGGKIEMYSPLYYAACALGGLASCGLTHLAVTPLDLVKCNMQIDLARYKSISSGFGVLLKQQGFRGLFKGWMPTLLGYSVQGACKFGFYELFKKLYSDLAGTEHALKYKTLIYLVGSVSAEVIADVALCPMEAVKVRVQTQPGFAISLRDGLPKFIKSQGALGSKITDTMMKFTSFETIVEMIYKHAIRKPKDQCSKTLQLAVSFAGGYVAGVFCAVVSHPADNLVSFLNNSKGATVSDAVRQLGLWGLFTRGLPLRIVMIGTLTGAQWGIYDAFKVLVGLSTTGRVAPPTASNQEHAKQS